MQQMAQPGSRTVVEPAATRFAAGVDPSTLPRLGQLGGLLDRAIWPKY